MNLLRDVFLQGLCQNIEKVQYQGYDENEIWHCHNACSILQKAYWHFQEKKESDDEDVLFFLKWIASLSDIIDMNIIHQNIHDYFSHELLILFRHVLYASLSNHSTITSKTNTLFSLFPHQKMVCSPLSSRGIHEYQKLFKHGFWDSLPKMLDITLIIGERAETVNRQVMGWASKSDNSIVLLSPSPIICIHEYFHLLDERLHMTHMAVHSIDERLNFFEELYEILIDATPNNVINPFYFCDTINGRIDYRVNMHDMLSVVQSNTPIKNWFVNWLSRDKEQNYWLVPDELMARLYTAAHIITQEDLPFIADNSLSLSLSAYTDDMEKNLLLKQNVKAWLNRFNDYVNHVLHHKIRQYPAPILNVSNQQFHKAAFDIVKRIKKIKQVFYPSIDLNTLPPVVSTIFSVVHFKNRQQNTLFDQHLMLYLEHYYQYANLPEKVKSDAVLASFVDYMKKNNNEPLVLNIGEINVELTPQEANALIQEYQSVLEAYDSCFNRNYIDVTHHV